MKPFFYLFKVCLHDPNYVALNSMRTYKVFPQSLLDVFGLFLAKGRFPFPLEGKNSIRGRPVANPLWPLEWLVSRGRWTVISNVLRYEELIDVATVHGICCNTLLRDLKNNQIKLKSIKYYHTNNSYFEPRS